MPGAIQKTLHCSLGFAGTVDTDSSGFQPVRGGAGVRRHARKMPEGNENRAGRSFSLLLKNAIALAAQRSTPCVITGPSRHIETFENAVFVDDWQIQGRVKAMGQRRLAAAGKTGDDYEGKRRPVHLFRLLLFEARQ